MAYLHKIDGLSLNSGDESSGQMSSDASCLSGGVSLIQMSHRSTATVTGLTMKTRAKPDLGEGEQQNVRLKNILTRLSLRVGLGKYHPLPWTERHLLSCLRHTPPSPSEMDISISGNWRSEATNIYELALDFTRWILPHRSVEFRR